MSTPVRDFSSLRSSDTELAIPSTSIPAFSASLLAARRYIERLFKVVPTVSASWITAFAAVPSAIVSSSVLLAADIAAELRVKISPRSFAVTGCVFATASILLTTSSAWSASKPKPCNVEIRYEDEVLTSSILSPTFLSRVE